MALSLVRYRFRGRSDVDFFVFLPLATPEVVLGAALLALFLTLGVNTGFATIVIAHVMFTISYVVVTVKARLEGMDRHIEEAAMDLGATEWATFRKVTLPMIAPGVAAAALLAAAISIDDYVITSFNAGQTQTFPLFIFGATRQGVPPEVNVLATALLVIVLVLMALNVVVQRRLAARDAARAEAEPHEQRSPPRVRTPNRAAGRRTSRGVNSRCGAPMTWRDVGSLPLDHPRAPLRARRRARRAGRPARAHDGHAAAGGALRRRLRRRGHRRRRRRGPDPRRAGAPPTAARCCSGPRSRP